MTCNLCPLKEGTIQTQARIISIQDGNLALYKRGGHSHVEVMTLKAALRGLLMEYGHLGVTEQQKRLIERGYTALADSAEKKR